MPKVSSGYGSAHRVNIVKKIKVDGAWNFYPAVVESNGKLKDKVRIKGIVEVHPEGVELFILQAAVEFRTEWPTVSNQKRLQTLNESPF
jgi:hypothetical protein